MKHVTIKFNKAENKSGINFSGWAAFYKPAERGHYWIPNLKSSLNFINSTFSTPFGIRLRDPAAGEGIVIKLLKTTETASIPHEIINQGEAAVASFTRLLSPIIFEEFAAYLKNGQIILKGDSESISMFREVFKHYGFSYAPVYPVVQSSANSAMNYLREKPGAARDQSAKSTKGAAGYQKDQEGGSAEAKQDAPQVNAPTPLYDQEHIGVRQKSSKDMRTPTQEKNEGAVLAKPSFDLKKARNQTKHKVQGLLDIHPQCQSEEGVRALLKRNLMKYSNGKPLPKKRFDRAVKQAMNYLEEKHAAARYQSAISTQGAAEYQKDQEGGSAEAKQDMPQVNAPPRDQSARSTQGAEGHQKDQEGGFAEAKQAVGSAAGEKESGGSAVDTKEVKIKRPTTLCKPEDRIKDLLKKKETYTTKRFTYYLISAYKNAIFEETRARVLEERYFLALNHFCRSPFNYAEDSRVIFEFAIEQGCLNVLKNIYETMDPVLWDRGITSAVVYSDILWRAVKNGRIASVKFICGTMRPKILSIFFRRGNGPDVLVNAIMCNQWDVVKFIRSGMPQQQQLWIDTLNSGNYSNELGENVKNNQLTNVTFFCEMLAEKKGISEEESDTYLQHLRNAASNKQFKIACQLINLCVAHNLKDEAMHVVVGAFSYFSLKEQRLLLKYLIRAGANVKAVDAEGNTVLHLLAKKGGVYEVKDIVKALIDEGADVNAANVKGEVALQLLPTQGAEGHQKDQEGGSAEAKQAYVFTNPLASGPDSDRAFAEGNQERWIEFSKDVISNFPTNLADFENVFRYLAKKRAEIASELKPNRWWEFGKFRGEHCGTYESISNEDKSPWASQSRRVIEYIEDLIRLSKNENKCWNYGIEGGVHTICVWSPIQEQRIDGKNHTQRLALILYDEKKQLVTIWYASINKYDFKGDMNLANRYYKAMMACDTSKPNGREEFLKYMGRLSHLITHILPLQRGTGAVLGWLMRGAANIKHITLGEFDFYSTGLSWDFKALLTPNREDYAEWFCKSAFKKVKYGTSDNQEEAKQDTPQVNALPRDQAARSTQGAAGYQMDQEGGSAEAKQDVPQEKPAPTREQQLQRIRLLILKAEDAANGYSRVKNNIFAIGKGKKATSIREAIRDLNLALEGGSNEKADGKISKCVENLKNALNIRRTLTSCDKAGDIDKEIDHDLSLSPR